MLKKTLLSFALAAQTIRTRFFHTVLSVLGIVIGVAALVSTLSLIDGLEEYANEQISQTTSLKAIAIYTKPYKTINNVRVPKENFAILSPAQINQLHASLSQPSQPYMLVSQGNEVTMPGDTQRIGAMISGTLPTLQPNSKLIQGRTFTAEELTAQKPVALVNESFLRQRKSTSPPLGQTIRTPQGELTIVGIVASDTLRPAQVFIPASLYPLEQLRSLRVDYAFEAGQVEHVAPLKKEMQDWLKKNIPQGGEDFEIVTNEFRVEQAAQGFLVFRIIMGFIVGLSVLVGGIGVMNVLLISVTERTSEIGVRKAMGAKKRDILLQFLSESITVSTFGSLMGLVLGVLATMAFVPIVKTFAKVPFQAAYTLNTFLIISVIAVLIGIVFGTYPALRAANLDPIEAIRRE